MKVLGYINTNGYFPSPLTMLTLDSGNDYFLHYPNGERHPIVCDQESIANDKSVLRASPDTEVEIDGLAYGLNEAHIVTGSGEEVRLQLTEILSSDNLGSSDRAQVKAFLVEFSESRNVLDNYSENLWSPSAIDLDIVESIGRLKVFFSDRVVSSRGESRVAKRLHVQFDKNGSVKTAYRKNLNIDSEIVNPKIPYQAIRPFMGK